MVEVIEGVRVHDLRIIPTQNGLVRHASKKIDDDFHGFGEAYFSIINKGRINGWKKHKKNTCTLIAAHGAVKFYFKNPNVSERVVEMCTDVEKHYARIVIDPGVMFAFESISENPSIILNVMNNIHDANETINIEFISK